MVNTFSTDKSDGNSYLIKDSASDRAYSLLNEKVGYGYKGLCVTRTNPQDLQKRHNLGVPFIWLTNHKNKDFFSSTNISILKNKIKSFIKDNEKSVVLLDRLDYLINTQGFKEVINLIYSLNDELLGANSVLMLNINPSTLNSQQMCLLEQELKEVPKPILKAESEIPDDLHEILIFVKNSENVTFKKVSKEFSITKTTTRKRINKLHDMNLIVVKKNGRNKIVRITEKGKNKIST